MMDRFILTSKANTLHVILGTESSQCCIITVINASLVQSTFFVSITINYLHVEEDYRLPSICITHANKFALTPFPREL